MSRGTNFAVIYRIFHLIDLASSANCFIILPPYYLSASASVNQLSFNVGGLLQRYKTISRRIRVHGPPANGTISFHLKGQYSAQLFK